MVLLNKLIFQTSIAILLLLLLPNFFCVFSGTEETQSSSLSLSLTLPPLDLEILNFLDIRLTLVFPVIQAFKLTVTSDPFGITRSWVGSDVCSYRGFICDSPPDNRSATAVASVDFNGFQLAAPTLDGFIDKLPDLAVFHANSNQFSGEVSPKISELPFLYELDLSNNLFSGDFPISVLRMNSLSFLDIRFNFFTGSVPPQIFAKSLDFLFLNNNNFDLTLPENLGSTPASYLSLANNGFTGPIPRTIGNASSTLVEVLFLNNLLTGCLPSEIGFLDNAIVFDAGNNSLAGPLPSSLGCLYKIEQMNFAGNLLSGKVPDTVCQLGNLQNLSLSDNYFTSVGRSCKKLIKSGVLDLRRNCIPDLPDQRPANECSIFFLTPKTCPTQEVSEINQCKSVSAQMHQSKRPMRKLVTYAALSAFRL